MALKISEHSLVHSAYIHFSSFAKQVQHMHVFQAKTQ